MDRHRIAPAAGVVAPTLLVAPLAACSPAVGPAVRSRPAVPELPGRDSVRNGRFVVPVELDDGLLLVQPAPPSMRPRLPRGRTAAVIWASPVGGGDRSGSVLGFGLVTTHVSGPDVSLVHRLPAWVGLAWGGAVACPMIPAASNTPVPQVLPSNGYVAVVVDARSGAPAFTYAARSSSCGERPTGPKIAMATKTLSIPWRQVAPRAGATIRVSFRLPPCGRLVSTDVSGSSAAATVELDATTPDEPLPCPAPVTRTTRVNVATAATVDHAPLGLVRQIEL